MSGSSLLDLGRRGRPLTVPDVIDMHGHLGAYQFAIPDRSPDAMVRVMDGVGVHQIVCSSLGCMTGRVETGNREVLEATRAYPGRILGYLTLWPASAESVEAEARRYLGEEGFIGVKLHDGNGFTYTDEAYAPALAIADERRMPVLLHTWGQEAQFEQIPRLAERYPRAAFLLAHSGSMHEDRYIQAARERPNVYLDLCLSLSHVRLIERLIEGAGADKIVWGSDVYFLSMTQQIGKVLGARCGDADKVKILSTNARGLLDRIAR